MKLDVISILMMHEILIKLFLVNSSLCKFYTYDVFDTTDDRKIKIQLIIRFILSEIKYRKVVCDTKSKNIIIKKLFKL